MIVALCVGIAAEWVHFRFETCLDGRVADFEGTFVEIVAVYVVVTAAVLLFEHAVAVHSTTALGARMGSVRWNAICVEKAVIR